MRKLKSSIAREHVEPHESTNDELYDNMRDTTLHCHQLSMTYPSIPAAFIVGADVYKHRQIPESTLEAAQISLMSARQ